MKNQNDLIISISVGVVALIVAAVIFFTAPQATQPAAPTAVDTSAPKLPAADVTYTNGLPGASAAGGPGGMGGMMGGAGSGMSRGFSKGKQGMGLGMGMGAPPGMGGAPARGGGRD